MEKTGVENMVIRINRLDRLIWPVISYGVEIWGWKEREEVERLEERYLRWTFGLDRRTPGYLIREEIKRGKLRERAGERAWGFENRIEEGRGSELARLCWEKMRERSKRGKTGSEWEDQREEDFSKKGKKTKEIERKREEGELEFGKLIKGDREEQREERRKKIGESKYNRWYGWIIEEGIPKYLKEGWGESRWRRVMRYRLGNEMREGLYWEKEENRKCRLCGGEVESWEHVWEKCRDWRVGEKGWQEEVGRILGGEGEGEWWMRKVEKERENEEKGRLEGMIDKDKEKDE